MSCIPKRDPNGTWRIQYRWKDYTGKSCKSQKRGFRTKKEAEEWYMQFMLQQSDDITMTLSKFWEVYKRNCEADAQLHGIQSERNRSAYPVSGRELPIRYGSLLYHESRIRYRSVCGRGDKQICDGNRK